MVKAPKQELKAFDVALQNLTNALVATPPTFQVLNACVNGPEIYQRVGRKMYMKSLHIRGVFNATAGAVQQEARLIIYYDSQPNAANPTIQTLLQDSNAAAATTWTSEINLVNRQRFKILRDYQVMLGDVSAISGATEIIPDPIMNSYNVDFFIKLKGLETIFNATNGGTIADISSGSIGITLVGSSTTDGNWVFSYSTRLRYYD